MKFSAAIFILFCSLGIFGSVHAQNASIDSFSIKKAEDVKSYLTTSNTLVILDVRTPEEFKKGHLENAVNINYYTPDFLNNLKALDPNKTYFIYCATGGRSRGTCSALKALQFNHVRYYAGFYIDLEKALKP